MRSRDIPSAFGPYQVLEYLNGGSFGHVYRVCKHCHHQYALKWLRADAEREGIQRFENEAWALNKLDHPVIPKLVDQGQSDGRPYIVMTLARGTSLRKLFSDQLKEGGASGHMRVLAIAEAVLDALTHMQERRIYHRDVKDDNIVATDSVSHVSLLDFGFCKGSRQPVDVASFFKVGAPRYSPPSKLRHPAKVHPTHDVFAVGVVAYLLLTNQYPWSVSETEDAGDLEEQMRTRALVPVSEINNLVPKDVSRFFANLLDIDDDHRPNPSKARDEARKLLAACSSQIAAPAISRRRQITFPRVIRDALHGDIRATEFEWKILNSRECQRLRWIKQLGFSNFVFPSAEHTRMNHAIGTMHVTEKILTSVEKIAGVPLDPEEHLMVRSYALTHDILHIAYGHTLEDELTFYEQHDSNMGRLFRLLLSDNSDVGNLLRSTEYGRAILAHFDKKAAVPDYKYITELVHGPAGADVLDYVDRDSYFCGLDHRIDSAIFRRFSVVPVKRASGEEQRLVTRTYGAHGFRPDAELALENVLRERFSLHLKVYTHPAKVAAGAMLGKALGEAVYGGNKPEIDERRIEWMGDLELLIMLRTSRRRMCRDIAKMLFQRDLYKPVFRATALHSKERNEGQYKARINQFEEKRLLCPEGRRKAESKLAKKAGIKPSDVIVYCSPKAPGFQKVRQYVERQPGWAEVRDEVHGPYFSILERHLGLWAVYVFATPNLDPGAAAKLGEASEELFGLANEVAMNRRQGILFGTDL